MKREDYRYGNLMQDRIGRISRVEGITKDGVDIRAIDHPITSLPCEPIPLTEEWLLKLGFEKHNHYNTDNPDNGTAYDLDCFGRICLVNGVLKADQYYFLDGLTTEIKYVHQLQNLYFALTGEELIYKP